ncbi:MAG: hydroxymethylbilane synthase [Sulfobacillus acidophilus]|uniref:Porphobilinogen deaminase n=1 Tax=Sulfobacillus acidophilus TaxID=53633 RepID=A0A2T2WJ49_9FIRM|nr:MAG: hydroxymethylbilane synthase [Sulfobacillus acidophilus]
MAHIRIATRSSQLAIAQAEAVAAVLQKEGHTTELVPIETQGDQVLDRQLHEIGRKGIFTQELETALLTNQVDLAVHSLKDLPTVLPPGLVIGAYALPEDRRDVLISGGDSLATLSAGACVGTSSLRRMAFLKAIRPDLRVVPVRGNVQTRLQKWSNGQADALVLAAAGLVRLGWSDRITEYLDPQVMVPSPGQGVLAIEIASHRDDVKPLMQRLNDSNSQVLAQAERAVLAEMGSNCQLPLGAYAQWVGPGRLELTAQVSDVQGQEVLQQTIQCNAQQASASGHALGRALLERGALRLIKSPGGK